MFSRAKIQINSPKRHFGIHIFCANCVVIAKINHHSAQTLKKIKITSYEVYLRNILYLCGQVT